MKQQLLNLEKKPQLAAKKISEKYKKMREANAKKQKNKTYLIDNKTYQQLKDDDFISLAPENKTSSFIDDRTHKQLKDDDFISLKGDEEVKKITDVHKKQKQKQKIETINEIKKFAANKNKTIAANKILKKYKNMKKPKKKHIQQMKKIQRPLTIVNLNIYFMERAYSMPQINFLTLMNLKNSRKRPLNILNNLMKTF